MKKEVKIISTDRALATGFFEDSGEVDKWLIVLPSKNIDMRLSYGQICAILDRAKLYSGVEFDMVTICEGDYTDEASYAIKKDLRRLPLSSEAVVNGPARLIWC